MVLYKPVKGFGIDSDGPAATGDTSLPLEAPVLEFSVTTTIATTDTYIICMQTTHMHTSLAFFSPRMTLFVGTAFKPEPLLLLFRHALSAFERCSRPEFEKRGEEEDGYMNPVWENV